MKWEIIDDEHSRVKIRGGWLVKAYNGENIALAFVPDPMHAWVLE